MRLSSLRRVAVKDSSGSVAFHTNDACMMLPKQSMFLQHEVLSISLSSYDLASNTDGPPTDLLPLLPCFLASLLPSTASIDLSSFSISIGLRRLQGGSDPRPLSYDVKPVPTIPAKFVPAPSLSAAQICTYTHIYMAPLYGSLQVW